MSHADAQPRVLLVEPDRAFGEGLKRHLHGLGCAVLWVASAEDTFTAAAENPPHLVLLADQLGEVSGLKVCNGLKRDPKLGRIPVVLMCAPPMPDVSEHEELPTRADAYVEKSDSMLEILEEVRLVAARFERLVGAGGPPPSSEEVSLDDLVDPGPAPPDTPKLPVALASSRPEPGKTLEVVYEQPDSEPGEQRSSAPAIIREEITEPPSTLRELERVEAAFAVERERLEERIAELEEQVALLERTVEDQLAYIEKLEGD